ncbi:glycosyl hydrolase family 28-related protein [Sediminibacillus halophilus]|uniref:Pectate lyase superfamily protein n=1 Tax=Sediminibacillus halophilus TaxID=482461 RepID=A0A1G9X6C6_9BACI|nr:glycosyl hydrolase family 28-related protein [Sediminibacillus halophilus]SDM92237.1 Pectate lyase superfamily protein [Sediminibacillus halophilus]
MYEWEGRQGPCQNRELIGKYLPENVQPKQTARLLKKRYWQIRSNRRIVKSELQSGKSLGQWLMEGLKRIVSQKANPGLTNQEPAFENADSVYPNWKITLDAQREVLFQKIEREVDVAAYGAVGDGITDCTKAFRRAIGNGNVKVNIPAGCYVVKEIKLPSYTFLQGAGKGETVIKLSDSAPKWTRLITNANHFHGNSHLYVEGMTLDWNVERLKELEKTSFGNNYSSCLTYAQVLYGWVRQVEAVNPGLHGFDISSTYYNYAGDGFRGKGESSYIWLDQLTGRGFGDDGVTTHHSRKILISNSHMSDPSGRAHQQGNSNSNGFEVDDGSQHVWLVNNSSARCFGGVEVKAHPNSSAAMHTIIAGHISIHDNRSYNFRHIGHHHREEPESKTAEGILAVNLVSICPVYSTLYQTSSPRALVVSGYRNVGIDNLMALGDENYDYQDNPVIAVQYRADNVWLNNIYTKDFVKAGADIQLFGGSNHAGDVVIGRMDSENSAREKLKAGKEVLLKSFKQIE